MKKILITGADSYIGNAFESFLADSKDLYWIDTVNMIDGSWKTFDFSPYDVVFHVSGIAHADVGNVVEKTKRLYYEVNTDLAVETARKAKAEGVGQFIFMSSMIVYSGCKEEFITESTKPKPLNFYGDSKWQADRKIRELADEKFKVAVLRPPMIYGRGSKGNYPQLAHLATKLPIFPKVKNKRSMLHIDNLCSFLKLIIDNEDNGVFFPQNGEYVCTSEMVGLIAKVKHHKIIIIPGFGWAVKLLTHIPGKIGGLASKAFGDNAYDMRLSEYKDDYRVVDLKDSVLRTEG